MAKMNTKEILENVVKPNAKEFINELFEYKDIGSLLTEDLVTQCVSSPLKLDEVDESIYYFCNKLAELDQSDLNKILTSKNLVNFLSHTFDFRVIPNLLDKLDVNAFKEIDLASLNSFQSLQLLPKIKGPISSEISIDGYDPSVQAFLKKTYCALPASQFSIQEFCELLNKSLTNPVFKQIIDVAVGYDGDIFIGNCKGAVETDRGGFFVKDLGTIFINSDQQKMESIVSSIFHEITHKVVFHSELSGPDILAKEADTVYEEYMVGKSCTTKFWSKTMVEGAEKSHHGDEIYPYFIEQMLYLVMHPGSFIDISSEVARKLWNDFSTDILKETTLVETMPTASFRDLSWIKKPSSETVNLFNELLSKVDKGEEKVLDLELIKNQNLGKAISELEGNRLSNCLKLLCDSLIHYQNHEYVIPLMSGMKIEVWHSFLDTLFEFSKEKLHFLFNKEHIADYLTKGNSAIYAPQAKLVKKLIPISPFFSLEELKDIFDENALIKIKETSSSHVLGILNKYMEISHFPHEALLDDHSSSTSANFAGDLHHHNGCVR